MSKSRGKYAKLWAEVEDVLRRAKADTEHIAEENGLHVSPDIEREIIDRAGRIKANTNLNYPDIEALRDLLMLVIQRERQCHLDDFELYYGLNPRDPYRTQQ